MLKKTWKLYLFVILIAHIGSRLDAQFTPAEQSEIVKKSTKLLADYETKMNQLGKEVKSIDKTRGNIEKLLELFADPKTQVFNDLDPSHLLSKYYEAETYATNIALWYPGGIKITLDFGNAQVSNILTHGENVYSIDVKADKKTEGVYLGKTSNNNTEKLIFRIGFLYEKKALQNFLITGIYSAADKKYSNENDKVFEIKSIKFPANIKRDIDRETKTIINDYANYLSLIGDTVENIEDKIMYKSSFRGLFEDNFCQLFNDVLPEGRKNQYVTVADYINLYSEAYASDGGKVSFDIDSADLGYIFKANDSIYYRHVQVNKSFEGNYLGKRKVILKSRVKITIIFMYANNVYKNFRIQKIDQVSLDKAEIIENRTFTDLNKKPIPKKVEPPSRKELNPAKVKNDSLIIYSINCSVGEGVIMSGDLNGLTIDKNAHEWTTKPGLWYSFSCQIAYMLKPFWGIYAGIGYSAQSTKYSVNSYSDSDTAFHDPTNYLDINGDIYHKMIKVKYDSVVSMNFINIPVGIVLDIKIIKNIHFYFKPGVELGFITMATSKSEGFLNYYGYYINETAPVLQVKNWPEFGAYTITATNTTQNIKSSFNSFNLNVSSTLGLGISLSSNSSLILSGNLQYGLTDLMKSKENYVDIFGRTEINNPQTGFGKSDYNLALLNSQHATKHKPVRIFNYGLAIEFRIMF
jgi:hypothetical protein